MKNIPWTLRKQKALDKELDSWLNKPEWCKLLIWSNLAKIAPASGGNPLETEREAQMPLSKQLFDLEIRDIQPPYVILLTNWNTWGKYYIDETNYNIHEIKVDEIIQAIASPKYNDKVKIIVTKRGWNERILKIWVNTVNEILKHL